MRIGSYKTDGQAEPHDFILLDDEGEFIDEGVPQYVLKFMWEQQEKIEELDKEVEVLHRRSQYNLMYGNDGGL